MEWLGWTERVGMVKKFQWVVVERRSMAMIQRSNIVLAVTALSNVLWQLFVLVVFLFLVSLHLLGAMAVLTMHVVEPLLRQPLRLLQAIFVIPIFILFIVKRLSSRHSKL